MACAHQLRKKKKNHAKRPSNGLCEQALDKKSEKERKKEREKKKLQKEVVSKTGFERPKSFDLDRFSPTNVTAFFFFTNFAREAQRGPGRPWRRRG